MRRVTETVARQWELLSLIPREPRAISTAEIRSHLAGNGYDVDVRTIQRDLTALEIKFALRCRTEGRTNLWFWSRGQVPLQIPALSSVTAITLLLVRDYLLPVLPSSVISELKPYFAKAAEQLKGTKFGRWASRVRVVHRGPPLTAPTVAPGVRDAVYAALLDNRQLEVRYRNRDALEPKQMTVNPLGLVIKDDVFYLVATLWGYHDVRQLALHRMTGARQLDSPVEPSEPFSLCDYVEEDAFAYRVSAEEIKLEALFDAETARHLLERRLSPSQKARVTRDGRVMLEARVADTQELRWWLLGFGAQVEVLKPKALRREITDIARSMVRRYSRQKDL